MRKVLLPSFGNINFQFCGYHCRGRENHASSSVSPRTAAAVAAPKYVPADPLPTCQVLTDGEAALFLQSPFSKFTRQAESLVTDYHSLTFYAFKFARRPLSSVTSIV